MKITQGSDEWHELREKCRENLYFLTAKVLGFENLIPMTPKAHYGLCRFAERKTGIPEIDNSRIQMIAVARGWGKSSTVTIGRSIQRILQDRDYSIGIANEASDKAKKFLSAIKAQFESNDLLRLLFPEVIPDLKDTTWKSDEIVVNRTRPNPVNPSVAAVGVGSQTAGYHLNEWILDDIISDDAAENARAGAWTEIEKTNRWIDRLQYLLKRPKQDPITIIYTPWWPGDCYDYAEEVFGRGEEPERFLWTLNLPADPRTGEADTQRIELVQKGELAMFRLRPFSDGRLIFPEVYDWDTLERLREDEPHFYSGQVLLNPTTGATTTFKEEYLSEFWFENDNQIGYRNHEGRIEYERIKDLRTILAVDPAISPKTSAARSAVTVVGSNGKFLFLLESWAKRAPPTDVAETVLDFYLRYRPSRILIESVAYQMALAEIITLLAEKRKIREPLPIHEFKTGSQIKKSQRISGLEPYFRKGLFYWYPRDQQDFFEEYTHFSPEIGSRKVDILDSISMMKESWEHLSFLGNERGDWADQKFVEADRKRQRKIRDFYSKGRRTREWDRTRAGSGSGGRYRDSDLWYRT